MALRRAAIRDQNIRGMRVWEASGCHTVGAEHIVVGNDYQVLV
jgi:hypothetical protein